jgi:endonuclease YncB( thermonuclease family)
MLFVSPAELFGRAPPLIGQISADTHQTAVVDGETLRVRDTVVRLLGVAAPARGQLCHHADGSVFDCGAASAEALARLVADYPVECRLLGHDENSHVVAMCQADGRDLNHAQVMDGWARARAESSSVASGLGSGTRSFGANEAEARTQHRGLWAGNFDPQS